jgi:hypothetical protein
VLSFSFEISAFATASFDRRLNRAGKIVPAASFSEDLFFWVTASPKKHFYDNALYLQVMFICRTKAMTMDPLTSRVDE